jgi:hypothetical protein
MMDLLSWSRYVTFDDEPTHLYLARNEKINEIKKEDLGVEVNSAIKARKDSTKATLGDMEAKATSSIIAFF